MKRTSEDKGPWQWGGLTLGQLGKRVYSELTKDAVFDAAAALGYYFMLALFPLLLFLVSLLSTIQSLNLVDVVMQSLRNAMPGDAYSLVGKELERILSEPSTGILTLGALGTLWAASSGVVSLIDGLNRTYSVAESRGFVKQRLVAIGLTIALALLIILGAVLLMMGDLVIDWVTKQTGIDSLGVIGGIVSYLLGLGFMFVGLELIFYFGPNIEDRKWKWITPGSLAAVILFVGSSFGFNLYLRYGGGYSATYGSLGGVIVLMLWLYLLGLAIMIGGEINSEIAIAAQEKGAPDAPRVPVEPDSQVPGKNKTLDDETRPADYGQGIPLFARGTVPALPPHRSTERLPLAPRSMKPEALHHREKYGSMQLKRQRAIERLLQTKEQSVEEAKGLYSSHGRQTWKFWSGLGYAAALGLLFYKGLTSHQGDNPV